MRKPVNPVSVRLSFDNLDATEFEEFCFDVLKQAGYINVDWRKGTAKKASPSDRGRDIVAERERTDVDGLKYTERWFVDSKHYEKGVPPEALQGLMTWAEAEQPDVVLVMASGYLSNPAKDWLDQYQKNRRPPFRIRHWERPQLADIVTAHPDLIYKHNVEVEGFRSIAEILGAETERFEKVWYGRKPPDGNFDDREVPQSILDGMFTEMKRLEDKYGSEAMQPGSDFEWGMLSGELSALRWVLGDGWGNLDT
ncbi:hypothetical protein ABA31_14990 [Agrococcus baldri]|uniref:Restriction endonuclease type IV Mrr domain-containing protein n=2 Tax=Agrococcus baldri TaxID=153730 RepID=A0AA87RIU0_9MICO|nr:hypothetical protein ABA31_14990 [Agrococcus baldri]